MRSPWLWFAGLGLAAWATLLVWVRARPSESAEPPVAPVVAVESHRVTDRMLDDSKRLGGQAAPAFSLQDESGTLRDGPIPGDRPTLLLFIKDGCPCSAGMQPYFNALARSYAGAARFLGVIDVDSGRARSWGGEHRVAFPILADPEVATMRAYGATNSAYVALIDGEGRVDMFWPGVSAGMLEALNDRIAALAGVEARPIDVEEAPEDLYSGCPYNL